jgi:alkyldihydroxyacetonephosphate synthase
MTARELSFWGWGWADKFPDDEGRAAIASSVAAMLGFAGLAPRPAPRLEDVALHPPRVAVPEALAAFTTSDRRARIFHTYGKNFRDLVRGFEKDFSPAPDLVAKPRDEDEVAAVLAWAEREKVAVIPFGGGTSVCGGVEADLGPARDRFAGVLSLDMRAIDRVLEIDRTSRAARIQAGATGPRLEAQLGEQGLTLRHFPQSFEFSTLGGWIVTRAGGHFATVYTHIDDLVESVRMITPRGPWESRRLPASGAGPAPDRLVLGSEGILGVVTEAWMRVFERPRFRAGASVHFARFEDVVLATRLIAQSGLHPTNCRVLDAHEAGLNFVTGPGNEEGSHVLILGFESSDHPCDAWIDRAVAIAAEHGGRTPRGVSKKQMGEKANDANAASSWRAAFLEAPYLQSALVSMGAVVDTFETACTWDRFPALHAAVTEAVRAAMVRVCGEGRISCRFTHVYPDGPAPYYTFVAPGRAGEQIEQWWAIKRAASDALIANGATITHHHAVGRLHRPWYERERPALLEDALRAVKQSLDPHAVLNPGVLLESRP